MVCSIAIKRPIIELPKGVMLIKPRGLLDKGRIIKIALLLSSWIVTLEEVHLRRGYERML